MKKTTKREYKLFKDECKNWINKFGLRSYEVEYAHFDFHDDIFKLAYCAMNPTTRYVQLGLSKTWGDDDFLSDRNISKAAVHEVGHMLLAQLVKCAKDRWVTEAEINEAEHAIIRVLENVFYPV